jgi:cell wall-associated NlpC family hydrolase
MSIADVTSRISEIRGQLGLLAPQAPVTLPSTAPATGADFASVLARSGTEARHTSASATGGLDARLGLGALKRIAPPAPTASAVSTAGATAEQQVVAEARKYLGVPYLWGGTDPRRGLDCSGLVQLVYRKMGIELPRVSYQQATAGRPVASLAEARPGDILAFKSPVNHVGIYIGDNKMIEAPRTGVDVRVMEVYETPTAIRRVLPASASGPSAAGATTAAASSGAVSRTGGIEGGAGLPASTPFASLFESAGARYGVEPSLLAAVATQESAFNPRAVSHAGAQGLMQLMPATAAGLGVTNSFDPAQAVDGAARLLRDLLREFGRVDHALAAYNAGPGAVHRYNGVPPYAETQKYVPAVLAHKTRLENA